MNLPISMNQGSRGAATAKSGRTSSVRRGLLPVRAIPDPCIPSRGSLCRVHPIQARCYSSQKGCTATICGHICHGTPVHDDGAAAALAGREAAKGPGVHAWRGHNCSGSQSENNCVMRLSRTLGFGNRVRSYRLCRIPTDPAQG